jgi:hypothetical protein
VSSQASRASWTSHLPTWRPPQPLQPSSCLWPVLVWVWPPRARLYLWDPTPLVRAHTTLSVIVTASCLPVRVQGKTGKADHPRGCPAHNITKQEFVPAHAGPSGCSSGLLDTCVSSEASLWPSCPSPERFVLFVVWISLFCRVASLFYCFLFAPVLSRVWPGQVPQFPQV